MLSQHDRRALADIEAHLRASDPELARRLERSPATPPPRGRRAGRAPGLAGLAGLAGLCFGLILLATAFVAHNSDAAVSAVVVLMAVSIGTAGCLVTRFRDRHRMKA